MEFVIFPIAAAFCMVVAIAIRIMGPSLTYKIFFAILAWVLLLKGIRG